MAVALVTIMTLGACAGGGPDADPYEQANREVHQFNRTLDRAVLRPASQAYGFALPEVARDRVSNFAGNLSLPGEVINRVLQGNGEVAGETFFRFMVNSTLGVFGLFDPASDFGLQRRETDFGETLAVWGAGEGAYVEVPVFGGYTQRHLAGTIVDFGLNPFTYLDPTNGTYPQTRTASRAGSVLNYRYEFSDTVDSVLYESADSYAQTKLLYLQNRRYTLGRSTGGTSSGGGDSGIIDPYADVQPAGSPEGTAAAAETITPYEDPYGQ